MIGVIFSYVKCAVVFCIMLAAIAASAVLICLYTRTRSDMVLRLVGLGIVLIATYCASFAYTFKLMAEEIDRVGNRACNPEKLGARLYKLSRRALIKRVRSAILLEYARTQIYCGKYQDAMLSVSDSIVCGGDGAKGDAAVCFCQIFFMQNDKEYFAKYYDKATQTLQGRAELKDPDDRAAAIATLTAIECMQLHFAGDTQAAIRKLDAFTPTGVVPMQVKSLNALREHIAAAI